MNSNKLFNINYFKQNLKKSKGLLTLLVLVIPVLTILMLICRNQEIYVNEIRIIDISIINIFGMYIIPIIISILLYGYVYKRNSVDFINSMPISRSSIFITNFIAGIVLILTIQILTLVGTIVFGMILGNLVIPILMCIDVFIVMFIGYSFMFAATTLAMTVSGNFLTQIVVTLLVVFLIPFSCLGSKGFDFRNKVNLDLGNRFIELYEIENSTFTPPAQVLASGIVMNAPFYSSGIIVKSFILIILYFLAGLYLFNKRKMENLGKSFSKIWVHLVVKGITLLPMIFILRVLKPESIYVVISFIVIFIYYLLYDFITGTKVPFKNTVVSFIASAIALIGIYEGLNKVNDVLYTQNINENDIVSISIGSENSNYYTMPYKSYELEFMITDKKLISKFLDSIISHNYNEDNKESLENNIENDFEYSVYKYAKLELKNGKKLEVNLNIKQSDYKNIITEALHNEITLAKYKEFLTVENGYVIYDGKLLSKENTNKFIELYNNSIENLLKIENIGESGFLEKTIYSPNFVIYTYRNHELQSFYVDQTASPELYEFVSNLLMSEAIKEIDNLDKEVELEIPYVCIDSYIVNKKYSQNFNYTSMKLNMDIVNYIEDHKNDTCNYNKPFYIIQIYFSNKIRYCYLNETEELNDIILEYSEDNDTYRD